MLSVKLLASSHRGTGVFRRPLLSAHRNNFLDGASRVLVRNIGQIVVWEHCLITVPLARAQRLRCSPESCSGVAVALSLVAWDKKAMTKNVVLVLLIARWLHSQYWQQTREGVVFQTQNP